MGARLNRRSLAIQNGATCHCCYRCVRVDGLWPVPPTLSWWDRLLGTYRAQPTMGHEAMVVGVAGFAVGDVLDLGHLLVQPMVRQPDTPIDLGARHQSEERPLGLTGRKS